MTTFDEVPRIERIALIARAMEYKIEAVKIASFVGDFETVCLSGGIEFDPYTNASQSQDVQERLRVLTDPIVDGIQWSARISYAIERTVAETLREAIADCTARWQWEKERAGK